MKRKRHKKAEVITDYAEAPKYTLQIPNESFGKELTFDVTDDITKRILQKPIESVIADGFERSGKLLSQITASAYAPPAPVTMESIKSMMAKINEEREERERQLAEALELAERAENSRNWWDTGSYQYSSTNTSNSIRVDPYTTWAADYIYTANTRRTYASSRGSQQFRTPDWIPDWDRMGVDTSKLSPFEDEDVPRVPYAQIRTTGLPFGSRISEADD